MSISAIVKQKLWASSGGYCQNPSCRKYFFIFFEDGTISKFDELAHIIAEKKKGPRGESKLSPNQRNEYDNIILLCPICHTIIDKNAGQYPPEVLRRWKQEHAEKIKELFSIPKYSSRKELSKEIHRLLQKNKVIFEEYGPYSSHIKDPLTDAVKVWKRYIMSEIIPNNRRIWKLLETNKDLLTLKEGEITDRFKLHFETFEYNQVSGDKNSTAILFPQEMNEVLKEDL